MEKKEDKYMEKLDLTLLHKQFDVNNQDSLPHKTEEPFFITPQIHEDLWSQIIYAAETKDKEALIKLRTLAEHSSFTQAEKLWCEIVIIENLEAPMAEYVALLHKYKENHFQGMEDYFEMGALFIAKKKYQDCVEALKKEKENDRMRLQEKSSIVDEKRAEKQQAQDNLIRHFNT